MTRPLLFALALLAPACGSDGLERSDVEDLAPGDATGSDASGVYELELFARDCLGSCLVRAGVITASLCDAGELATEIVEVTQTDGRLVMDSAGLVVERITGGIDADGSFEVGGFGTQYGGSVAVAVYSSGTLEGDRFTGTAQSRGSGSVEGNSIDCTAIYEISGVRTGDLDL